MTKKIFTTITFVIFILNLLHSLLFRLDLNKILISVINKQETVEYKILTQIRIPRTIATHLVGAGLAVVGCVLQSIFLNPLCEGYTLGISSAAGLGVVVSTILMLPLNRFFSSFFGVLVAMISIHFLLRLFRRTIDVSFILSGVVLNFFFSSIIIILTLFFDPYKTHYVLLWLLGSFSSIDTTSILISCTVILILLVAIVSYAKQMDIIILGKEKAITLGVKEQKVKSVLIFICVVICALCVSISGTISFVGVIVPNVVKSITGLKHKEWFLTSMFTGSIFISLCDNLARNLMYPMEIPINVLTGILGSIFFIVYILKGNFYGVVKS
ncbi:MAG: iron ABC transporter permease [Endomicrobia bacterium]|nr:iron ABC transporter permease [Endomicrobiia bacterium]MDW8056192.1 iron ABC transporter permease [Elusimicrobiota bacterium]